MAKRGKRRKKTQDVFKEPRFSLDEALEESMRCLQCFDAPCTAECAAHIPIPRFIRMIRSGNFTGAAEVVRDAHPFAGACGEVCPDDALCQAVCTRGKLDFPVRIRMLHQFVTDYDAKHGAREHAWRREGSKKAAVVGGGPAGLSCARQLALSGVKVDLYEKDASLGGICAAQIPSFRLPGSVLKRDIGRAVGKNLTVRKRKEVTDLDDLAARYDAVFVGAGAYGDASPGLPGENLKGVWQSAEFLSALKTGRLKNPESIVVIGGGNVALDCSVASLHEGAKKVGLYYRRSFNQMPAWKRELEMVLRAGVELVMLAIPRAFVGRKGKLVGVGFFRAKLGKPGKDGRRLPVRIPRSEFTVSCDTAVIATGQGVEHRLSRQLMKGGGAIGFNERNMKVRGNIFIGGDIAGRGTIVEAVGDGKKAAEAIIKRLHFTT